jgi:hypothetical protein
MLVVVAKRRTISSVSSVEPSSPTRISRDAVELFSDVKGPVQRGDHY